MKNRPNALNEPRDLGREWHSDSEFTELEPLELFSPFLLSTILSYDA